MVSASRSGTLSCRMKKRIFLLTVPLILSLAFLLNWGEKDRAREEPVAEVPGAASDVRKPTREDRMRALADAEYVEADVPDLAEQVDQPENIVRTRRVIPKNFSGVELARLPAGISQVDQVLFERETPGPDGIRRARVLKTDFHYPLLQTVELLHPNPKSGEEEVIGYRSMVADHVLAQIDTDRAPANWQDALSERGFTIRREVGADGLYVLGFELEQADQVSEVVDTLSRDLAWVEYAEPDFVVAARSHEPIPNDPLFDMLWGMRNTGQAGGVPGKDIKAVDGWAKQIELQRQRQLANGVSEENLELTPGAGFWRGAAEPGKVGKKNYVIVAVLDSGVNYRHVDLVENMWINPNETSGNFHDDDGNGYVDDIHGISLEYRDGDPMDLNGHGTHVAGTIGAIGNNSVGVAGVAWDVKIMAIQFLNAFGGGVLSDSIPGIDYAWQNGAHILNNSWGFDAYGRWFGGMGPSNALSSAIQRSRNAGAIFVTAAGNESEDVDIYPDYPPSYQNLTDNIVNVGSMEPSGNRSIWQRFRLIPFLPWDPVIDVDIGSNYGRENVQIFAPGTDIVSTYAFGIDTYAILSGTSMASPHVAGLYAVLKAEYPDEPYFVLIQRLLQRADVEPQLAGLGQKGRRANLARALDPAPLIYQPLDENLEIVMGGPVHLQVKVSHSGLSAGDAYRWFYNGVEASSGTLATDPTGPLAFDFEAAQPGNYRFEITSAFGTSTSMGEVRHVSPSEIGGALGTALGAPYLAWQTGGAAGWVPDGENGARSGAVSHGEFSELAAMVTGPGRLTFEWNASSEKDYDFGEFRINGVLQGDPLSGASGWLPRQYELPAGTHQLTWIYKKDSGNSVGEDLLRLRAVNFESVHPLIVGQSHWGTLAFVRGDSITLDYQARGPGLEYFWRKGNKYIPGATLTLDNIQDSDAGMYVGYVRNSHGIAETLPVTIQVDGEIVAPEFVLHPESAVTRAGGSVTLRAEWVGTYPVAAQWHKDGVPLPGKTGPTLSLSNVQEADAGNYTVIVENTAGEAVSHSGIVAVLPPVVSFEEYVLSSGADSSANVLLRYALGLDRFENPAAALPKLVMENPTSIRIAMDGGSEAGATGSQIPALEFYIPLDSAAIDYQLESSVDLNTWTAVESDILAVGEPEGTLQKVRLRPAHAASHSGERYFLRLRVQHVE